MSHKKNQEKITWHIVSIKPGNPISTGKNYEAYDLLEACQQWNKDVENKGQEILVAYSSNIVNMPLFRASEITAVELQE